VNLKDLPFPVYGNAKFRGKCPPEAVEMASFFSRLRREYPDTLGRIALHPRNEAMLIGGQFKAIVKHKAEGMTKGASDVVIPARVPFICELKRCNHTLSAWQDGQKEYLTAAQNMGAFACVALGAEAAWAALMDWMKENEA